ncbi:MAG TPA: metalloregulator ArsR/SmtB family transcription factor [Acidimicrobiales bacterium]|nr:metalloregulator ArsR/SmtB family transcription factor [Acidimicrobiales bacterium]
MSSIAAIEVLAEPTRRQILDLLRDGERSVGDLVGDMRVTQPTVSKHLRVLRDSGLVDVRVDAQRRLYRVRPEPLIELDAWLATYRGLWTESLDRLERHLDAKASRRKEPT